MTTEPLVPPLQVTLVTLVEADREPDAEMVRGMVAGQPLPSVAVKWWLPAPRFVWAGVMVYGAVPPAGVITTEPLVPPLQATLVTLVVAVREPDAEIVTGTVSVQPLASVMVKV